MNDSEFLRKICEGYVQCYRTLNIRTRQNWGDLTQRELDFLSRLGLMLGFSTRTEDNRIDLGWYEAQEELVLHVERETERGRVFSDTLEKLLTSKAKYLIAVLGWVLEEDTKEIRERVCRRIADRFMAVIAWVGPSKDGATQVWAFVCSRQQCFSRIGQGEVGKAGFWYAHFLDPWKEKEMMSSGALPSSPTL